MNTMSNQTKNYAVAVLFGMIGGGLFVALVTKAIPKMASQIVSEMMQTMINRMRESGCDPSEM